MKAVRTSGTENYAEEAPELLKRDESISFADHHRSVIHLIPTVPGRVLDIGAGTWRDAAGLVGLGHSVVAVEPTEELRRGAMVLHPIALPLPLGLRCSLRQEAEPSLRQPGVSWTRLAFRKASAL
jgi:hypothetical protein